MIISTYYELILHAWGLGMKHLFSLAVFTFTVICVLPVFAQSQAVKKRTSEAPFVFYYYDEEYKGLAVEPEINRKVFSFFDGGNQNISGGEYYDDRMVAFERLEFDDRTFQDVSLGTVVPMSYEEYLERIKSLNSYNTYNTNGDDGLSPYEMAEEAGFRKSDDDNDNQVSFDEFVEALTGQKAKTIENERYN